MRELTDQLEVLVRKYQQAIGGYIWHLVREGDRARFLTAEVFVHAHRAGVEWERDEVQKVWLYRTATELALTADCTSVPPVNGAARRSPSDSPVDRAEVDCVQRALYHMEWADRAVLLLSDLEDLTSEEVAEVLRDDRRAITRRLQVARARWLQSYVMEHAAQTGLLTREL